MKLQQFLHKIEQSSFLEGQHKICFVLHDEYPFLFFSQLLQKIKGRFDGSIERLDLELQDQAAIRGKLEMTGFFSNRTLFWLGHISKMPAKKRNWWLDYVRGYQSSHTLGICINQEELACLDKECLQIVVPPAVDRTDFELLVQFFHPSMMAAFKKLGRHLFMRGFTLPLDKACLLLQYGQVLGNNIKQFCDEWLAVLVESEQSLLKVSEYFLSKRVREFFLLWSTIGSRYPDVFWISFWSDTLWRSYHYVNAMRNHDLAEARKISFRLPFSFLKSGWKKVDPEQLKRAHQFLYTIDYNLKNGVGGYGLELLYFNFFLGQFARRDNDLMCVDRETIP